MSRTVSKAFTAFNNKAFEKNQPFEAAGFKRIRCLADTSIVDPRTASISVSLALAAMLVGCSESPAWPPLPKNQQEKRMIESALRAVDQFDRWDHVACVVERQGTKWKVQAWHIVHPEAVGRARCAPWAVRGITLDEDATVLAYENHL